MFIEMLSIPNDNNSGKIDGIFVFVSNNNYCNFRLLCLQMFGKLLYYLDFYFTTKLLLLSVSQLFSELLIVITIYIYILL